MIQSLAVEYVRSHRKFSRQLSRSVTIITGPNGSGKTSLIEAITIALKGKSFKGSDDELLKHGAEWWRIDVQLGDETRTVKYQPDQVKKKTFVIDSKSYQRLPQTARVPVVLFEPDDLRLLGGSPTRRRQFIDKLATQLIPDYGKVLHRYERALLQRNRLLKNNAPADALFAWNVGLAKYGAQIIDIRVRLIERMNEKLNKTYKTIAQKNDTVSMHYSHTVIDHTEQKILNELESKTERDKILGFTSVGPHRHDVMFQFNEMSASNAASRGETRTILLALKFIEVELIEDIVEQQPIILLDDVLSELDDKRQLHLATKFQNHQIIMTSTNPPTGFGEAKIIRLR